MIHRKTLRDRKKQKSGGTSETQHQMSKEASVTMRSSVKTPKSSKERRKNNKSVKTTQTAHEASQKKTRENHKEKLKLTMFFTQNL